MSTPPRVGAPTAGWQPDPFRRHELRFRDGELWTEHVSDRGIAGIDTTPVAGLPRSRPPDRTAGSESPPVTVGAPVRVLPETTHAVPPLAAARILLVEQGPTGGPGPAGLDRAVDDEHGNRIGTVRIGREHLGARALRMLTTSARPNLTEVDVFGPGGEVLLSLDRPARFLKPRTLVTRGDGTPVGAIVPRQVLSGLRYDLEAGGEVHGTVEGDGPADREVRVRDRSGTVVARVSTTWEVVAASHHPTPGTYLVIFERPVPDPLHSLALGALLALDPLLVPAGGTGA